mgnify:CR=1 FL=1
MEQSHIINLDEKRDFEVNSSNLKHVRSFCREVFEKLNINQELKDELVLAIAEAAQNIVKHAYNNEQTEDKMEIKISVSDGHLEIGFFDSNMIGGLTGPSIRLNYDGNIIAIGNAANNNYYGSVTVFKYEPNKNYEQTDENQSDFGPIGWSILGSRINNPVNYQ